MTTIDERSWVPVLRGRTYCSPGCRYGCTKAAHDKAVADANALAKLLGEGWETRVWENLGWHYSVRKGAAEIHVNANSYTVFINSSFQVIMKHADPREALRLALEEMRLLISGLSADRDYLLGVK